jgi:rubrerythrin
MKLSSKDGRFFLTGKKAEVEKTLSKQSSREQYIDLGWTLSKRADEASISDGEKYMCKGCNYSGNEHEFPNGGCPKCRGKNIVPN